ncbi:hypothetical protein RAN3_2563 [plant metagenome]|uniref:Uncharacterized protein n=1 Tax=plant metagenome TaxID=1297885 RepID=A0A484U2T3_9ZZZZ
MDSLTVERLNAGGHNPNPPIPDLQDPVLMTLHTSRAMLFRGWEEIDGQRYYQVWWIQWVGW